MVQGISAASSSTPVAATQKVRERRPDEMETKSAKNIEAGAAVKENLTAQEEKRAALRDEDEQKRQTLENAKSVRQVDVSA